MIIHQRHVSATKAILRLNTKSHTHTHTHTHIYIYIYIYYMPGMLRKTWNCNINISYLVIFALFTLVYVTVSSLTPQSFVYQPRLLSTAGNECKDWMTSLHTQFRECQYSGSEVEEKNPPHTHTHTHKHTPSIAISQVKHKNVKLFYA